MRRTPVFDPFDDHDDPDYAPGPNVRRISTDQRQERAPRRADLRPLRTPPRRPPPRRGPDPRVWFIRGAIGIAALAGLWLGLQAVFPVDESQVSQAPTPAQPIDASAVGAPEPPAAQPAAQESAVQQPAPTIVTQAAPAAEGDRLPGLPTPAALPAESQAAPAAPVAAAPPAPAQEPAPSQESAPAQDAAPSVQPAAEPQPREETPSQQPVGTPTLDPIPPPASAQADAAPPPPAEQPAPQPAQRAAAPAPKPQAPPPAAAASGGPFQLAASASPANPVSERAMVTISVRATQGGAPVAGASCMATIHYRTNTARQPSGGFRTNANGVGSFTLDARGTTYGYYVPVDVTCNGRGGTVSARTGFTPVRGR